MDDVDEDGLLAKLATEAHDAVDTKLRSWFGRESELGAYALEDVLALGRHVI